MGKTILIYVAGFFVGAVATALPFMITGHFAHLDETARGEPTMGPGMTTFLGLVLSPFGGLLAVLILRLFVVRKSHARKRD